MDAGCSFGRHAQLQLGQAQLQLGQAQLQLGQAQLEVKTAQTQRADAADRLQQPDGVRGNKSGCIRMTKSAMNGGIATQEIGETGDVGHGSYAFAGHELVQSLDVVAHAVLIVSFDEQAGIGLVASDLSHTSIAVRHFVECVDRSRQKLAGRGTG